jgi:serine/threonine protein kinase
MGEVFRARDTRLDRTVAIKILPAEFADNAELRSRFEREARTISQISHPHICALHDVGRAEGVEYLVLEFIEGETLGDRIARGPLPISRTCFASEARSRRRLPARTAPESCIET